MKNKIIGLVTTLLMIASVIINPGYAKENAYPTIGYIGNNKVAHVTVDDKKVISIKAEGTNQPPLQRAKSIAKTLNRLQYQKKLRADKILPSIRGKHYVARIDNEVLFTVDKKLANSEKTHQNLLTMKWIDSLRDSLGGVPFEYQVSRGLPTYSKSVQYGYASWYGSMFHGRQTASGEVYNMYEYTAAHRTLPLGTAVLVTNLNTGRSVLVKVNDRGPFAHTDKRVLDLSQSAFKAIAPLGSGVVRIRIDILS